MATPSLRRLGAAPMPAIIPAFIRALVPALLPALLLGGCAVEFQNREAAQTLAAQERPPGSVYAGWRVYQDRCAACHGPAAEGSTNGPDLLPRVRVLGARQFVDRVLQRYDWRLPPPGRAPGAREAQVDSVLQRREGALAMPAWQGEPRVNAHIVDLYAYLSARAEGTQGPARPPAP